MSRKKKPKKRTVTADDSTSEDEATPNVKTHRQTKAKTKPRPKPKRNLKATAVVEEIAEEDDQIVLEPDVVVEDDSGQESHASVGFNLYR